MSYQMRDNLTPEQREFMQQYIFSMQNEIENLKLSNESYKNTIETMNADHYTLQQRLIYMEQNYNNLMMKVDNILFSFQNMSNAVFSGRASD